MFLMLSMFWQISFQIFWTPVHENIHLSASLPTLNSIICLHFCQFCCWKPGSDFIHILKSLSEVVYYFPVYRPIASLLLWIIVYDYLKNSYIEWNYTYYLIGNSYIGLLLSFLLASHCCFKSCRLRLTNGYFRLLPMARKIQNP